MKDIKTYLYEHLILENNLYFYPDKKSSGGKFFLYYGENEYDHVQTRMYERNVSKQDIIKSFSDIFNKLNDDYKNKKLLCNDESDGKNTNKNEFTIINKKLNKTIVAYLEDNKGINKLFKPHFVIKTVFNNSNFKPHKNDLIYYIN